MSATPSNLAAAVARFNELNRNCLGLLLPLDRETVESAASLAALRQRPDIGRELLVAYQEAGEGAAK